MLNIKLLDKVSNYELKKKTNFRYIRVVETCNNKKRKWAGHIQKLKDNRWTKRAMDWCLQNYNSRKG